MKNKAQRTYYTYRMSLCHPVLMHCMHRQTATTTLRWLRSSKQAGKQASQPSSSPLSLLKWGHISRSYYSTNGARVAEQIRSFRQLMHGQGGGIGLVGLNSKNYDLLQTFRSYIADANYNGTCGLQPSKRRLQPVHCDWHFPAANHQDKKFFTFL